MKSYQSIIREKCFDCSSSSSSSSSSRNKTLQVQSSTAVILLSQFEKLLQKYKEYLNNGSKDDDDDDDHGGKVACDQQPEAGGQEVQEGHFYTTVATAIEQMALDIFSLSAMYIRQKDDASTGSGNSLDNSRMIRNMILPVLLKIMQHMIDFLMHVIGMDCGTPSCPCQKKRMRRDIVAKVKYCIAVATLIALAFCKDAEFQNMDNKGESLMVKLTSSELNVWEIVDSKHLWTTWKNMFMDQSTFSPTFVKDCDNYLGSLFQFADLKGENDKGLSSSSLSWASLMDKSMVDFQQSNTSTFPSSWIDSTNGIGARTATSLLQQISKLCLLLVETNDDDDKNDDDDTDKHRDNQHTTTLHHGKCFQDIILDTVGSEYMCQMTRELFFGRLTSSGTRAVEKSRGKDSNSTLLFKSMSSHDLAFNGIISSKKRLEDAGNLDSQLPVVQSNRTKRLITRHILEYTESEPFKEVPALTVASIRVMAALKFPNISSNVLMDVIPVVFTLIDSYTEYHQAFGAAILWNILNNVTPTCFVSSRENDDAGKNSYFENAQKVLSLACRTCKHSLSLCLLTMARTKLFEMAPSREANKLRRDAVSISFEWIQKNSFAGPGAEPEALEVLFICLVSCVQPLLHELAQLPEAGAMELGRSGMRVLLPLIRWDSNTIWGRKIQVASMECLLSLMMGAYPIMERHGGKIMSELISCIGRLQRDVDIQNKLERDGFDHDEDDELLAATKMTMVVALHVASAALVLCGRRAEEVLSKVETGSYIKSLVDACSIVRSSAAIMKK